MSEKMSYTIARRERPACYPARLTTYAQPWESRDAEYDSSVPEFTSPVVLANAENLPTGGKCGPTLQQLTPCVWGNARPLLVARKPSCLNRESSTTQRDSAFFFPGGRTGIRGRGLLGRYGPNHAADPIVTRFSSVTGNLEVVVVVRSDCDMIALPGGMVNPGEDVAKTLYSEFTEEAARPNGAVERLFERV